MTHPSHIEHYEDPLALARALADLRYDALTELVFALRRELAKDAAEDHRRGRLNLSCQLFAATNGLHEAAEHLLDAWRICEPHMKERDRP